MHGATIKIISNVLLAVTGNVPEDVKFGICAFCNLEYHSRYSLQRG